MTSTIAQIFPRIAVDETEAAQAIGMSVHFLRKDRRDKRIIPFFRIGDCIGYDLSRVREALAAFEEGGIKLKPRPVRSSSLEEKRK